jgi:branched-chain amino acid transport system substrate-binding protein
MMRLSRRAALGALASSALARPAILRAQTGSAPIKIGLISDVAGPYRDNGGPGNKLAVEMAAADFGGALLGRPLQVMQADGQNKPDVAGAIAREWIDTQDVRVLVDGASSSAALGIQQIARDKKCVYLMTNSIADALVGKQCSPYGFQFPGNAYSLTKGVADTLTRQGGDTWFIITVDYESGYALQANMEAFAKGAGGKVLGGVRAPIGTADYSSFLVQAKTSAAKVIGLGLAGADVQNCVKQAAEFGIIQGGQTIATPILEEPDVLAIGQDVCKGLMLSASFYWNLNPPTRAWSERFIAKMNRPPNQHQAAAYTSVMHWLKAAQAVGTLDGEAVAAKMHATAVDDFYHSNVRILPSGSVPVTMYLFEVKSTAEAKEKWDLYEMRGSLPSPKAFPDSGYFGCPLAPS